MKTLFRVKKKEMQGFKEYVLQMETTSIDKRTHSFLMAALEDPVYMNWVAMNVFSIEKFLTLDDKDISLIIKNVSGKEKILAQAFHKSAYYEKFSKFVPETLQENFRYECELLGEGNAKIQEVAQFAIIRTFRKLQNDGYTYAHPWRLPEVNIVKNPMNSPPSGQFYYRYEDGQLALQGTLQGKNRVGEWEHFYPQGKIMAKGPYVEDEPDGEWFFYYTSGKVKAQGQFSKSKKVGTWKEYDRAGECKEVPY